MYIDGNTETKLRKIIEKKSWIDNYWHERRNKRIGWIIEIKIIKIKILFFPNNTLDFHS